MLKVIFLIGVTKKELEPMFSAFCIQPWILAKEGLGEEQTKCKP